MKSPEKTVIYQKIMTWLLVVLPPVIAANIAHWSATVIMGKRVSRKARIAIFCGSFGIAAAVHALVAATGLEKWEWALIWLSGVSTVPVLKFIYLEAGEIIKNWFRNTLKQGLAYLNKK